jgi:hypothetical protein
MREKIELAEKLGEVSGESNSFALTGIDNLLIMFRPFEFPTKLWVPTL